MRKAQCCLQGIPDEYLPVFTQLLSVQCCPAQGIAAMPYRKSRCMLAAATRPCRMTTEFGYAVFTALWMTHAMPAAMHTACMYVHHVLRPSGPLIQHSDDDAKVGGSKGWDAFSLFKASPRHGGHASRRKWCFTSCVTTSTKKGCILVKPQ